MTELRAKMEELAQAKADRVAVEMALQVIFYQCVCL